jgi:hypothetical protein
MAAAKRSRVRGPGDFYTFGQPAPERMALETNPGAAVLSSYVVTEAAQRALAAINQTSAPGGILFWVSGPAGVGKTHFLNYVLALEQHAASLAVEHGRAATFAIELENPARLESQVLTALADALSSDGRKIPMWRRMEGADALKVALEQAHRVGFAAVTGVIDFGAADSACAAEYVGALAHAVVESKHVKFEVIAASRQSAPTDAIAIDVAPANSDEMLSVAVRRARILHEDAADCVAAYYQGFALGKLDPASVFPFHPEALSVLHFLSYPPGTIAAISALTRDALALLPAADRLVFPADLAEVPALMERVHARLGAGGKAALAIARAALAGLAGNERELAAQIVNTLVLMRACGSDDGMRTADLMALLPMLPAGAARDQWTASAVTRRLVELAARSRGVIAYVDAVASFDPEAANAPEIASFNGGLPLLRKFDPALAAAVEQVQIETQLAHLADCMAGAAEKADRVRRVIKQALAEAGAQLTADSRDALQRYSALAQNGARELLEVAADPGRRDAAMRTIEQFESLERAAGMVPRIRVMREYLEATGLRLSYDDDGAGDPSIAALETECQLLGAELGPRVLAASAGKLDAIEARFHKFKWSYVQRYRSAHARWRDEMQRTRALADDLRHNLDALARLNRIASLGVAEGEELSALAARASANVAACALDGHLALDLSPRCPSCGYTLGAAAPTRELPDLIERSRRALAGKLAALSHSAISRIIGEHDREHRLDGFLKVIQASQTDALVRVLDERLATYLSQLLDENLGEPGAGKNSRTAQPRRQRIR